jgi:hypothetical protein
LIELCFAIQPFQGCQAGDLLFFATGFTRGYSNIATSWHTPPLPHESKIDVVNHFVWLSQPTQKQQNLLCALLHSPVFYNKNEHPSYAQKVIPSVSISENPWTKNGATAKH